MFDDLFGAEYKLATSADAYLDRMEKILRIRTLLKELDNQELIKQYDAALGALVKKIEDEVMEAKAKAEEAKKKKEDAKPA